MREFHVNQSSEAHYTVYKLTSPKGKIYIGCTGQKPKKRWQNGKDYIRNIVLNSDITTYSWEAFSKEILCEKLTKEGAEGIEKRLIELLEARNPIKGYNVFTGGARLGAEVSAAAKRRMRITKIRMFQADPEYIAKISRTCREKYASPEYRAAQSKRIKDYIARTGDNMFRSPIPVVCIETGIEYPSMSAAEKAIGVCHCGISRVCNGTKCSAGGLHWRFA